MRSFCCGGLRKAGAGDVPSDTRGPIEGGRGEGWTGRASEGVAIGGDAERGCDVGVWLRGGELTEDEVTSVDGGIVDVDLRRDSGFAGAAGRFAGLSKLFELFKTGDTDIRSVERLAWA